MTKIEGRELFVQGVPAHIDYTGKTWDFLGPPVRDDDPAGRQVFRTIFVVTAEVHKTGQRYDDWILQLTDAEYFETSWPAMRKRIRAALHSKGLFAG